MPVKADFTKVFEELKSIFKPYTKKMDVSHDTDDHYMLNTPFIMRNKQPLCFGGVRKGKNYVSFYLMSVYAVPELLKDSDPKPLLHDVLSQLAEGGAATSAAERIDHALATMACHSVVRAGDVLGRPQVLSLLQQLDGVDLRSHCPHGRPVLLRLPMAEIERRFGRI